MRKNMILLMTVLLALCWYMTVGTWLERENNYRSAIAQAESFEERKLYLDAIQAYETAMKFSEDQEELMLRIARDYQSMGDKNSYLNSLQKIVASYGPSEESVTGIYNCYIESGRERDAIEYIAGLKEQYPSDPVVKSFYHVVQQNYFELYNSFQDLGDYFGEYAVYEYEGKKGLVDTAGEIVVEAVYDEIRVPMELSEGIPVREGGQVYIISKEGYKLAQPETDYEELGILSEQRMLARRDGKYGYLDSDLKEKTEFIWDEATNFCEGIAAVKSGDRWALINKKGEALTEYVYEDVKRDSHNFCSRNGILWVKENGSYRLINTELETVGEETYEDVKAFTSEEPCAVMQNGRWGYADISGKRVISCTLEDAQSFSLGYAAAKSGGLWGYIGTDGSLLIPYSYDEAKGFNEDGTAPVRRENSWRLIQLGLYR